MEDPSKQTEKYIGHFLDYATPLTYYNISAEKAKVLIWSLFMPLIFKNHDFAAVEFGR